MLLLSASGAVVYSFAAAGAHRSIMTKLITANLMKKYEPFVALISLCIGIVIMSYWRI